jgi:hypothetical protein
LDLISVLSGTLGNKSISKVEQVALSINRSKKLR